LHAWAIGCPDRGASGHDERARPDPAFRDDPETRSGDGAARASHQAPIQPATDTDRERLRGRELSFKQGAMTKSALQRTMIRTGAWAFLLTVTAIWVPMESLAQLYLRDDTPVGLAIGAALILLGLWKLPSLPPMPRWASGRVPLAALILLVGVVALAGTWLVFGNYGQARDEILADFAAQHLRAGVLLPPVPAQWHDYAEALQPKFMVKVPGDRFWISGYLPGNSLLRAILGPATGPLLAMLACLAVYRVARRLWPDDREPAVVALMLCATSAQLLVNAMTPFAMTAHLALNMLWLWLFLRGTRSDDALAMATGWLACGLHQIIFHLLFVAPFVIQLWFRGERRRAVMYALAYAAIALFWTFYWQMLLHVLSAPLGRAEGEAGNGVTVLLGRIVDMVSGFTVLDVWLMIANLLRFLTWQNLIVVPLMALSWPAIRAGEGIARPLAAGIMLLLAALFLLMPFQGIGWGYRYLNGVIGSAGLLAAYGWRAAVRESRGQALTILSIALAATVLVVIPWQMVHAHRIVKPYRVAYQRLIRTPADIVLVDDGRLFFAGDLVRNRWDLSNRPLVMELALLDESSLRTLCRRYRVALFDQPDGVAAGIFPGTGGWVEQSAANHAVLDKLGCAERRIVPSKP